MCIQSYSSIRIRRVILTPLTLARIEGTSGGTEAAVRWQVVSIRCRLLERGPAAPTRTPILHAPSLSSEDIVRPQETQQVNKNYNSFMLFYH